MRERPQKHCHTCELPKVICACEEAAAYDAAFSFFIKETPMQDELIEAMAQGMTALAVSRLAEQRWEPANDAPDATFADYAQAALAEIKANGFAVGRGWQDIASAPVNEVVWAYGTIEGDYGYTEDRNDMVKAIKDKAGAWYFAQPMGRHDRLTWRPTHWMPLPDAPLTAAQEPGEG
jgi:hypothetical protein